MPKKTRKFIDKKNSVTFQLVHRSQKDPLIADERAPQRVLVPISDQKTDKCAKSLNNEQRKEEQQKYGIFFDDEYNYLQHLQDVNKLSTEWERIDNPSLDNTKINLPSSVFESNIEEKTGILNKASASSGLVLDLDPDIVAAMDDDFDFDNPDNELEDNFIELAGVESNEQIDLEKNYETCTNSDEASDDSMSLKSEFTFKNEETKSRFTEYSMSSNIIKRNEQLTLLDDKFEKMFASYDENAIGALDNEEIEGFIKPDSDTLLLYIDEYENQRNDVDDLTVLMKDRMLFGINDNHNVDEEESYIKFERVDVNEKKKFDCQSVISTYTNIYNHPKLIIEPKTISKINVNSKNGIPENILNDRKNENLTIRNLAQYDIKCGANNKSMVGLSPSEMSKHISLRKKNETPEQKRERKLAIKTYRKERRMERKFNIKTFKEEKKRQEKILINEKNNIQGNRIL